LALMDFGGKIISRTDKADVRRGVIGLDFIDQLIDFYVFEHRFTDACGAAAQAATR